VESPVLSWPIFDDLPFEASGQLFDEYSAERQREILAEAGVLRHAERDIRSGRGRVEEPIRIERLGILEPTGIAMALPHAAVARQRRISQVSTAAPVRDLRATGPATAAPKARAA